ncbi:hypothetical protein [Janthinobacterium sp. RB2R34]|uniref:hypothetical protein n=1 Tax=Janthinobacterium sp. RB2R34 TaxID=3424193 RepID=UPI003F248745
MTHEIPPHIHPKLVPFVYRSTKVACQTITKFETRTVPGTVTAVVGPMSSVTVHQQTHSVLEQVDGGIVTFFTALFEAPDGHTVGFSLAEDQIVLPGTVIYLGIEAEYWVFQYERMARPQVVISAPPGGEAAPSLPWSGTGADLQSAEAQLDLRAANYPIRSYLDRIGKNTPRTLLSAARLGVLMADAQTATGQRYNWTPWPRNKKDLPGDASFLERLLWPITKYKPVKTDDYFGMPQKVSGEVNKAWLGGGIALGTLANFFVSGTLLVDILRTLHLNQWFYMGTIAGVLVRWLFFTFCALAILSRFLKPAIKKPFKFDEDAFFKVINTPYHPRTRLGLWYGKSLYLRRYMPETTLMSDAQMEDHVLLCAHQDTAFVFTSYACLVKQLDDTKLSPQERQTLLDEIAATTPAY